jgi:2'-5' RNA ligase
VTAVERMLALAAADVSPAASMIYLQAPPALFPMATGDKPGHLTVVYLGKISPPEFSGACARAQSAAAAVPPVHATLGGLGMFSPTENSDGARVYYCPVYGDGIHWLRALLADLAAPDALPFVPHITLDYVTASDESDDFRPPVPVTSARVCFTQLYATRGAEVHAWPLSGRHDAHGSGQHYRDRRPDEAPLSRVDRVLALADEVAPGWGT